LDFSSEAEGGLNSPDGRPGRVLFLFVGVVLGEGGGKFGRKSVAIGLSSLTGD